MQQESFQRLALATIALFVLVTIAAAVVLRGPSPLPASSSPRQFSAARATAELARVMRADIPRTIGSTEHAAARARIAARLTELGYATEIQTKFVCAAHGACAEVRNIIATRPGIESGPGVLAVAHYDSVAAGPGASDAAAAVATMLETARAVSTEKFRRRITFLVTDGEEVGLLGARAFVSEPRYRSMADVAINLENRGTAGPSLLFETSRNNGGLITAASSALPRPVTTSLFVTIYESLPNDTDLSVFKEAGLAGVNFAALRDPWAYHTPRDEMRRVNQRTLQHHGDSVVSMLRQFAGEPTPHAKENVVHFDVLSMFLVSWPERFSFPVSLAILAAAVILFSARFRTATRGAVALPATVLAVALVSALLVAVAMLRAGTIRWIAIPAPLLTAIWLASFALSAIVATRVLRSSSPAGMVAASAVWWSALAVASSWWLPGASYLFIVPSATLVVASAAFAKSERFGNGLALLSGVTASVLWLPITIILYEALATPALVATAVALALVVSPSAYLLAGLSSRIPGVVLGAAFGLAILSVFLPPSTNARPRPVNLVLVGVEGSPTRWFASGITSDIKQATPFDTRPRAILPWSPRTKGYVGDATEFSFPLPAVETSSAREAGGTTTVLQVRTRRNAQRVTLWCRSDKSFEVLANGVLAGRSLNAGTWTRASVAAGEAVFTVRSAGAVDAYVTDTVFGLPAEAATVVRARDGSPAVPIQDGDATIAARKIAIR